MNSSIIKFFDIIYYYLSTKICDIFIFSALCNLCDPSVGCQVSGMKEQAFYLERVREHVLSSLIKILKLNSKFDTIFVELAVQLGTV